jgi:Glycosyl transferase family group 2
VSEGFDMSLRLQLKCYLIRWASYCNGGFKEGVSLKCGDELNRWEKYAYGCNEWVGGGCCGAVLIMRRSIHVQTSL